MKVDSPIIKILKLMKAKNGSLLDTVIMYLYDIKKMSVKEIAATLEISVSSIYKTLKRMSHNFNPLKNKGDKHGT